MDENYIEIKTNPRELAEVARDIALSREDTLELEDKRATGDSYLVPLGYEDKKIKIEIAENINPDFIYSTQVYIQLPWWKNLWGSIRDGLVLEVTNRPQKIDYTSGRGVIKGKVPTPDDARTEVFRPGLWIDYILSLSRQIQSEREESIRRAKGSPERPKEKANYTPIDDSDIFKT